METRALPSLKTIGLLLGTGVSAVLFFHYNPQPDQPEVGKMAAIATLMGILWVTEGLPMAATALLPLILFPLCGIQDSGTTAKAYMNPIIFLFLGGFLIGLSMERWNLHRRIALTLIGAIGQRADKLVLGFMAASGFLSMWISNTATAVMMLPIGLAVVAKLEEAFGRDRTHSICLALMLGIAYGCSIGGVATLVGTPTNLIFLRIFEEFFPAAPSISFGQWMFMGLPYAVILLLLAWLLLTRVVCRFDRSLSLDQNLMEAELKSLGPMRYEEKVVLTVFTLTAVAWIFRQDLNLGTIRLPGWSRLIEGGAWLDDSTVAIAASLLLFLIPARQGGKGARILEASAFTQLPWGIILLFGGGFAMAGGFASSGLSLHIGEVFRSVEAVPVFFLVLMVCLSVTFLTELTSNVATLTMFLPILAAWAVSLQVHPLLFALPATLSASMAFMMPVATPPNAVVFGSQRIRIAEMARAGLLLNLIAVALTLIAVYGLIPLITGANLAEFPEWARG